MISHPLSGPAAVPDDVSTAPSLRHLAFFMHGFEMGGAQRSTLMICNALAARGLKVDLVVVCGEGPLRAELDQAVTVHEVGSAWGRMPLLRKKRWWRVRTATLGLVRYLRRERPEVLVSSANHSALVTAAAHRWAAVPEIALVLRVTNPVRGGKRGLKHVFKRAALSRDLLRVDAVATLAPRLSEEIIALTPSVADRVAVMPNAVVDVARIEASRALPPPWPVDGRKTVLAVARFAPQKDLATLLRAFALLPVECNAKLVIYGDGPLRAELEALGAELGLQDRLSMPGLIANPFTAMHHADVFVLSSRWEGLPGTLLEAMACGCPVVSTDCPAGSREILLDGVLGPLPPVGDPQALAQAITQLLEQPSDRAALIARAQGYTAEASSTVLLQICEGAARRARLRAR